MDKDRLGFGTGIVFGHCLPRVRQNVESNAQTTPLRRFAPCLQLDRKLTGLQDVPTYQSGRH